MKQRTDAWRNITGRPRQNRAWHIQRERVNQKHAQAPEAGPAPHIGGAGTQPHARCTRVLVRSCVSAALHYVQCRSDAVLAALMRQQQRLQNRLAVAAQRAVGVHNCVCRHAGAALVWVCT